MDAKRLTSIGGVVLALWLSGVAVAQEARMPYVRIAELEIDPARLDAYKASVKEEMEASVRVEPGVLAIYAVAEKDHPTKVRFFEVYADEAAYNSHRESPHFKKYVETTKDMIKSRKLIETVPIQLSDKKK
uniref:putative quinol monooxygenase n=1 Tax=Paludisphaera soli TaxID=2712865 RepID=UPI0013E9AB6E|nr:putative quinol monooxygenase [Paludisphaera soli]